MDKNQNKDKRDALKFIQHAQEFVQADIERTRRTAKIAWRIAGACLLVTGLAVGAVAGLTPLKTVQPFIVRVDNNTGATDVVSVLKHAEKSYGEVIDKYWLGQYVRYREGYDWENVQDTFDATNLLSSPTVQQEFSKLYQDNANAPHKILRDTAKVIVKVKAISFVGKMAQIRFDKVMVSLGTDKTTSEPQRYIATVSYEYKNAPMKDEDRLINPLGFQITSYRVDKESTE